MATAVLLKGLILILLPTVLRVRHATATACRGLPPSILAYSTNYLWAVIINLNSEQIFLICLMLKTSVVLLMMAAPVTSCKLARQVQAVLFSVTLPRRDSFSLACDTCFL